MENASHGAPHEKRSQLADLHDKNSGVGTTFFHRITREKIHTYTARILKEIMVPGSYAAPDYYGEDGDDEVDNLRRGKSLLQAALEAEEKNLPQTKAIKRGGTRALRGQQNRFGAGGLQLHQQRFQQQLAKQNAKNQEKFGRTTLVFLPGIVEIRDLEESIKRVIHEEDMKLWNIKIFWLHSQHEERKHGYPP